MNNVLLPSNIKRLKSDVDLDKNAHKKNVDQYKSQNIPSRYLPVESQQLKL